MDTKDSNINKSGSDKEMEANSDKKDCNSDKMECNSDKMEGYNNKMEGYNNKMEGSNDKKDGDSYKKDKKQHDSDKEQHDSDKKQPDSDTGQPDSDTGQPDSETGQRDSDTGQHDSDKRQPDSDKRQPDSDKRQPDSDTGQPDSDTGQPDSDTKQPDSDTGQPDSDTKQRDSDTGQPDSDTGQPDSDTGQPDSDTKQRDSDTGQHDSEAAGSEDVEWDAAMMDRLCGGAACPGICVVDTDSPLMLRLCASYSNLHSSVRGPVLEAAKESKNNRLLLEIVKQGPLSDHHLLDIIFIFFLSENHDGLCEIFYSQSLNSQVLGQFFPAENEMNHVAFRQICLLRCCKMHCTYEEGNRCRYKDPCIQCLNERRVFRRQHLVFRKRFAEFYSRLFMIGVRHFMNRNDTGGLAAFCNKYGRLDRVPHGRYDWKILEAVKPNSDLGTASLKRLMSYDCVMMSIALSVAFEGSAPMTAKLLESMSRLVVKYSVGQMVGLVVRELFKGKHWRMYAPAVDGWLSSGDFPSLHLGYFKFMNKILQFDGGVRAAGASIAKNLEWCVSNSVHNLAFLLALALEDWATVQELLTKWCYNPPFRLEDCCELAVSRREFSVAAALLRVCSGSYYIVKRLAETMTERAERTQLADCCEKAGLTKYAVKLSVPDWHKVVYLAETGHDPDAVDCALEEAMRGRAWYVVQKLVVKSGDPLMLSQVLREAVFDGQLDTVKAVVKMVSEEDVGHYFPWSSIMLSECLLRMLTRNSPHMFEILSMLIKAGISAVNRANPRGVLNYLEGIFIYDMLSASDNMFAFTRLIVQSGAVSYKELDRLRQVQDRQKELEVLWYGRVRRDTYTAMLEAAATPSSLKHLARLAVSGAVGCHPGRQARINHLRIPQLLKVMINFEDVTRSFEIELDRERRERERQQREEELLDRD